MSEEVPDLSEAIANTELMIEYAATHGIELDQKVVKPVKDFARKWRDASSQTSAKDETEFWVATSQLATSMAPVNPRALRTLRDFDRNGPQSAVGKAASWARRGTWTILILTLLTHSYENTLGTIIQSAEEAAENFASVHSEVATITLPKDEEATEGFRQSVEQARGRYCAAARAWSMQIGIIEGLIPQGEGSIPEAILTSLWQLMPFTDVERFGPPKIKDNTDDFFQEKYPCTNKQLESNEVYEKILLGSLGSNDARQIMQWAQVDRAAFAQFVLPLLYGMLGALAGVVRALGTAVTNARYSPASGLIYTLKVPLGALVGATIGIVIEAETLASVAGLTSLGLAFGFAYAVDVFFFVLGRAHGKVVRRE